MKTDIFITMTIILQNISFVNHYFEIILISAKILKQYVVHIYFAYILTTHIFNYFTVFILYSAMHKKSTDNLILKANNIYERRLSNGHLR